MISELNLRSVMRTARNRELKLRAKIASRKPGTTIGQTEMEQLNQMITDNAASFYEDKYSLTHGEELEALCECGARRIDHVDASDESDFGGCISFREKR